MGRLIPAGTGFEWYRNARIPDVEQPMAGRARVHSPFCHEGHEATEGHEEHPRAFCF
jgi:hypothetical protein